MRGVTNVDLLHALAESYGFGTSYRASNGLVTEPPAESFIKLLRALGLSLNDDQRARLDSNIAALRTEAAIADKLF